MTQNPRFSSPLFSETALSTQKHHFFNTHALNSIYSNMELLLGLNGTPETQANDSIGSTSGYSIDNDGAAADG